MTETIADSAKKTCGLSTTSTVENIHTGTESVNAQNQACPACQQANLVLDGCLTLTCPVCGFSETGGAFT